MLVANIKKTKATKTSEKTRIKVECEETVKLLGDEIDYLLTFDTQVSIMCKKASQQITVLRRIGINLNFESRKAVCHAFIMSTFNFCPLVCHFCSKTNTEKLERIHFRALKFIFQDFDATYENLIMRAGTTTLHLSRLRGLALETFKIIHGNSPIYLHHFLTLKETCYNFRYTNLNLPRVRSSRYGTNSFSFQSAKLWNAFPKKLGKLPLLMSSNVLSRGGMGLAVNVICVNDLPPLIFLNFLPHAFLPYYIYNM